MSREYYRQVNVSNTVINNTVINNTYVSNVTNTTAPAQPRASYRNLQAPNAVTAVAPAAFAQGQRVDRVAVKMPSNTLNNAQIQPLAKVAPARTAFTGDAPAARTTPPAAVQQRAVIAKAAPPPARHRSHKGSPRSNAIRASHSIERRCRPRTPAGSPAAPERNVKVVNPAKTPVAPPPIAQRDNARARGAAPAATPGSPPSETPAAQGRKPEEAGKAPAAQGRKPDDAGKAPIAPAPPTEVARPAPVAPAPTPPRVVTTLPPAAMPAPAPAPPRGDTAKSTTPREPERAHRRIRHEGGTAAYRRARRAADEHTAAATRGRAACRAAGPAAPGAAMQAQPPRPATPVEAAPARPAEATPAPPKAQPHAGRRQPQRLES